MWTQTQRKMAGARWTGLLDGETTPSILEAPYVYYMALNVEAGLLHTAELGGGGLCVTD